MMNYLITPSTEELSMAPGKVDDRQYEEPISAGAHLQVFSEVVQGVISSLSRRLVSKGLPPEEVNAKMRGLLNTFAENGDLDTKFKTWLFDHDFADLRWDIHEELDKVRPSDKYDSWWILYDQARWGVRDAKYSDDYLKKMNDREKELLTTFREAQRKFYEAKRAYAEYVEDHTIETINEVITKYGETLSKMDKEWYDQIESRLKTEMADLERRRKQKKAESQATADRPTAS